MLRPSEGVIAEELRKLKPGTVLFREGESAREMFVIRKGEVEITREVGPQQVVLARLQAGEFFGEMAILNGRPRAATATIVKQAELVVVYWRTLQNMIQGNTEVAVRMLKKLAARLDDADEMIESLLYREQDYRVLLEIRRAAALSGRPEDGVELDEEEFARRTGMSKHTLHEVMDRLTDAGLVFRGFDDSIFVSPKGKLQDLMELREMKKLGLTQDLPVIKVDNDGNPA